MTDFSYKDFKFSNYSPDRGNYFKDLEKFSKKKWGRSLVVKKDGSLKEVGFIRTLLNYRNKDLKNLTKLRTMHFIAYGIKQQNLLGEANSEKSHVDKIAALVKRVGIKEQNDIKRLNELVYAKTNKAVTDKNIDGTIERFYQDHKKEYQSFEKKYAWIHGYEQKSKEDSSSSQSSSDTSIETADTESGSSTSSSSSVDDLSEDGTDIEETADPDDKDVETVDIELGSSTSSSSSIDDVSDDDTIEEDFDDDYTADSEQTVNHSDETSAKGKERVNSAPLNSPGSIIVEQDLPPSDPDKITDHDESKQERETEDGDLTNKEEDSEQGSLPSFGSPDQGNDAFPKSPYKRDKTRSLDLTSLKTKETSVKRRSVGSSPLSSEELNLNQRLVEEGHAAEANIASQDTADKQRLTDEEEPAKIDANSVQDDIIDQKTENLAEPQLDIPTAPPPPTLGVSTPPPQPKNPSVQPSEGSTSKSKLNKNPSNLAKQLSSRVGDRAAKFDAAAEQLREKVEKDLEVLNSSEAVAVRTQKREEEKQKEKEQAAAKGDLSRFLGEGLERQRQQAGLNVSTSLEDSFYGASLGDSFYGEPTKDVVGPSIIRAAEEINEFTDKTSKSFADLKAGFAEFNTLLNAKPRDERKFQSQYNLLLKLLRDFELKLGMMERHLNNEKKYLNEMNALLNVRAKRRNPDPVYQAQTADIKKKNEGMRLGFSKLKGIRDEALITTEKGVAIIGMIRESLRMNEPKKEFSLQDRIQQVGMESDLNNSLTASWFDTGPDEDIN